MPDMPSPIPYTGAELCSMLSFDSASGVLHWNERPAEHFATQSHCKSWNKRFAGTVAGARKRGGGKHYIQIAIDGRLYPAHRLVWLIHYNSLDESLEIDHINGEGVDNRIANLRLVSHQENQKNLARRIDNSSGVTGISWDSKRGKWLVRGYVSGKQRNLGRFNGFEEAVTERRRHEQENGYHELHGMIRKEKAAAA